MRASACSLTWSGPVSSPRREYPRASCAASGRPYRRSLSAEKRTKYDRPAQRLRCLGEATGLTPTDVDILELLLRYQIQPVIESLVDEIFLRVGRRTMPLNVRGAAMPALLGISAGAIHNRLTDGAPLVSSGLVSIDGDGDVTIVDRLRRLATVPGSEGLDASRLLLDPAPASELEWSDFDHIAEGRDHIERLIQGALRTSAPGVNILLYGPPGTGKTEFCKVLAERLGVTLYSVGEADDDGDEPSRSERLQELRLAQRLLARNRGSLLLFDEMEDLLSGSVSSGLSIFGQPFLVGGRSGSSKVFMHRLLERAPTPTLWAMNDASSISKAILRRMMFALELRPPTTAVRARIWNRQLEHHGIEAGPDEAHALAQRVRSDPWRGRRRHCGRADQRRRHRHGSTRGAWSLPGALLRGPAPRGAATLRPHPDPGRYRPGRTGGQPGGRAASNASPSACRGRRGRGRAPTSVTSPSE